jgi:hypothetical protein
MNETYYWFFCYKHSSTDMCRGCVMARYPSEFVGELISETALLSIWGDILFKNATKSHGEASYEDPKIFLQLPEGEAVWSLDSNNFQFLTPESELYLRLRGEAAALCVTKLKAHADAKAKAIADRLAVRESADRAELQRLKKLYGESNS